MVDKVYINPSYNGFSPIYPTWNNFEESIALIPESIV